MYKTLADLPMISVLQLAFLCILNTTVTNNDLVLFVQLQVVHRKAAIRKLATWSHTMTMIYSDMTVFTSAACWWINATKLCDCWFHHTLCHMKQQLIILLVSLNAVLFIVPLRQEFFKSRAGRFFSGGGIESHTATTKCNHKRWYYPPSHCLNVSVMLSNVTFLMIFAVFGLSLLTLWITCCCLIFIFVG